MDLFSLLSQDHQKIRQIFKKIGDTSARAFKRREFLFARLRQELELHAHNEEEYFYSQLRERPETKRLVEMALQSHRDIREMIASLDGVEKTEAGWAHQIMRLEEEVDRHVEEEERDLFPLTEMLLNKPELDEIARAIQRDRAAAE